MIAEQTTLCEKRYKTAEQKVVKILHRIERLKLDNSYVSRLNIPKINNFNNYNKTHTKYSLKCFTVLLIAAGIPSLYKLINYEKCLLELPPYTKSLFRPPEDCSMCMGLDNVTRLRDISAEEFEELYAYSTQPVIVTDATVGWRALEEFSFDFFADFYRIAATGRRINECFYFPYKSGLNSLAEVFLMDELRANLSGAPWYVGWSTCYDEEVRNLRQYYTRPYFLPRNAESDSVDWMFMGGPGQGAHMHVDSVRHMSWQAQIRGRKQWELAPPPECVYWCGWIKFVVEPGEILVVDTNRWYHKTNVLPGDISITIGAEFD